jgi:deoxyribodipyrimidine photo-lyase
LAENNTSATIVWFKRDLRIFDHRPLNEAIKSNKPIIPLYIFEPELWAEPDMSIRHYKFLLECIDDLKRQLSSIGLDLVIQVGNAVDILESFLGKEKSLSLFSHQETWNNWTYQRDIAVGKWAKLKSVTWKEYKQVAVERKLRSRNQWTKYWDEFISEGITPIPDNKIIGSKHESDKMPSDKTLNLTSMYLKNQQKGGRIAAVETLRSFLRTRGANYSRGISSPNTAAMSCSRISPYLAFGCLSIREIINATQLREFDVAQRNSSQSYQWQKSLSGFKERLRWHCHFIQKLEDEPEMEWRNLHPAYDDIRISNGDEDLKKLEAWKQGKTGFPFVDACMRSLVATGWINFRMRAMLISFASFHLWLDWKEPARYLARLFLDYEPGIHYPQVQMQAATTSINTIRIYNPIKQSEKQDPRGKFIRRWLPELAEVNDQMIHTPWLMCQPPQKYPYPIVDEKEARKNAASILYGLKKSLRGDDLSAKIVKRHASRKSRSRKNPNKKIEKELKKQKKMKKDTFTHHQGQGVLKL